ncbi:type IV pilin protein [Pseudomonas sp. NY15437]|uniref:type IV pilin protein n=1 Tax=Pseudomonas sp. NY15437 TaxID=3400360 RepID=UPI003A8C5DCB
MRQKGFSLIELMVVVAIVGIIAAIAYPSYQQYVLRSGRADGKAKLMEMLQAQERFFSQNQTYTATLGTGAGGLGYSADANGAVASESRKYNITAAACSGKTIANCVNLTATPTGAQANDAECGTLTVDSSGVKTKSGSAALATCW